MSTKCKTHPVIQRGALQCHATSRGRMMGQNNNLKQKRMECRGFDKSDPYGADDIDDADTRE